MKILIVNTDYIGFLLDLYATIPGLAEAPYSVQMGARINSLFGVADFYSSNLRDLGHESWDIFANNESMQRAWAKEHGISVETDCAWPVKRLMKVAPWFSRKYTCRWMYGVLEAQIKHYKPDVLLNQSMDGIPSSFFKKIKPHIGLLVGQHAATPLGQSKDLSVYDLCISSFPPTVTYFKKRGVRAQLHLLGFEPKVLKYIEDIPKSIDISFIGSFHPVHSTRKDLLEYLCRRLNVQIWTPDLDSLPPTSSIRRSYAGNAWGVTMYKILKSSRITLNHHGNIPPYANNMRLYEATGTGTLLVTDFKNNLSSIFDIGKEVISYSSMEECYKLIKYFLENNSDAENIAKHGQMRTLRDHSYAKRMEEFIEIVENLL